MSTPATTTDTPTDAKHTPTFYKLRKEFQPTWKPGTQVTELIAEGRPEGDYVRIFGWGLFKDGRGVYPLGPNCTITEAAPEEVEAEFERLGLTRTTERWCACRHSAEGHDANGRCMDYGCWCEDLRVAPATNSRTN